MLWAVADVKALALWVRGYVLCSGCEKGVHTKHSTPCHCDICEETK